MTAPKPTPRQQNWQVQETNGVSIEDFPTEDIARLAALRLRVALQRPVRVRRMA